MSAHGLQAKDDFGGMSDEHGRGPPPWKAAFDVGEAVGKAVDLRVGIKMATNCPRANRGWAEIQREKWQLRGRAGHRGRLPCPCCPQIRRAVAQAWPGCRLREALLLCGPGGKQRTGEEGKVPLGRALRIRRA